MKKLLFIMLAALTIVSCQKKDEPLQFQDVSFKALELSPDAGLKSTEEWPCKTDVPTNAWVVIDGVDYYPALFELDGVLYTQALKLPVLETGQYCITAFVLYKEVDGILGVLPATEAYPNGDIVVFGTPQPQSLYEVYIDEDYRFDYCFDVTAFAKAELPIEVLCYQDAEYDSFGFDWFQVTEIVVRQFCFFGDLCITDDTFPLYDGSIYAQGGIDPDEEAVFRMIVKDNGVEVPYSPFSNESIYNTGMALCVDYPDNLSETNNFTFELQVWQPDINGEFFWVTYATFTSTDAGNLFYDTEDLGNNTNVTSFAVGDCSPDSNPIFPFITLLIDETFEAYTAGGFLVAQANALDRDYWRTWTGNPGGEDPVISNAQAAAGLNSVLIEGADDAVGLIVGAYTEGLVKVDLDIYIPEGKTGYFNLLQRFNLTNPNASNWGMEDYFNPGGNGNIMPGNTSFTFTYNTWHHVSIIINLDIDNAEIFFNGVSKKSWTWSQLGTLNEFGALDLYGIPDSGAYFDNILITIIK